jgi:hypothetical protein
MKRILTKNKTGKQQRVRVSGKRRTLSRVRHGDTIQTVAELKSTVVVLQTELQLYEIASLES